MFDFDWVIDTDWTVFLFINSLPHTPFLDNVGSIFSFLGAFGLVWYVLAIGIYLSEKKKDTMFLGAMILGGFLSLFFVTFLFKPLFHRDRPDVTLGELVKVVTNKFFLETFSDMYAYPSGHTTIAFASALILSRKRKRFTWSFYLLALVIAFTRIYLGKHYPLDVIAGMALGTGIGWLCFSALDKKGFRSR